ncbi:AI-2E family transporter [Halomicrococcus gelatinilyticus]|uniref:AI-2E family transporter n=1 Tax=Halomicrococcus gelatinilyticus TaxID=1702103 RepID=UPI002E12344A
MTGSDDRFRRAWWVLAVAIAAMLAYAAYRYVGTFAFAVFLYYVGRPIARRVESVVGSAGMAASLTIALIILPFVAILAFVAAVAVEQVLALTAADWARFAALVDPYADLSLLSTSPRELLPVLAGEVENGEVLFRGALDALASALRLTFHVTLVFASVFFLLRDDRRAARWFRERVADEETAGYRFLAAVDRELDAVFFGQMLTIFAVMVLAWVLYSALNLLAPPGVAIPLPLLLGLLTGVATFIPLVGRSLVYVPLGLYLAALAVQGDPVDLWFAAVVPLSGWFGIDPTIRYLVRPAFTGRRTGTGLMLVAYLLGAATFGWYGVFLAPILLVVTLEFARQVFPALVHGDPVLATQRGERAENDGESSDGSAGSDEGVERDGRGAHVDDGRDERHDQGRSEGRNDRRNEGRDDETGTS